MRQISLAMFFVCLLGIVGCGGETGPQTITISGEVTFNGEPMPDGDIIFRPDDRNLAADAGKIQAGKYSMECKPGKKTVEIRGRRTVAGAKEQTLETGESGTETEQYIPLEFNDKTTLKADVTESVEKTFDFALTGK